MPNQLTASILTHDIIPDGGRLLQIVKSLGLSDTLVNEPLMDLVGEDPILQDFLQDTFRQLGFSEMKLQSRQEHFSLEDSVAHLQDETDLHIYDNHGVSGVNEEGEGVPIFTDMPMVLGNAGTLLMSNCHMDHHKAQQIATHITHPTSLSRGIGVWHGNGGEIMITFSGEGLFITSIQSQNANKTFDDNSVESTISAYLKGIHEARAYIPKKVMRIRKDLSSGVNRATIEANLSRVLGTYIERRAVVLAELPEEKLIDMYARFTFLERKLNKTRFLLQSKPHILSDTRVPKTHTHIDRKASRFMPLSRTFRDGSSDQGADFDLVSETGKPVYIRRTYDLKGVYIGEDPYFLALENQRIHKSLDTLLKGKRAKWIEEQLRLTKSSRLPFLPKRSIEQKSSKFLLEAFEELGVINTDFQLAYKQFFCDSIRYVAEVKELDTLMEESIQQFQNLEISKEDLFERLEGIQQKYSFDEACIVHYKQKMQGMILPTQVTLEKLYADLKAIGKLSSLAIPIMCFQSDKKVDLLLRNIKSIVNNVEDTIHKPVLVKRYLQEQLGEDFKLIADKLDFLEAKKEDQGLSRMKEVGVTRSVQLQSESSSVVSERSRARKNAMSS